MLLGAGGFGQERLVQRHGPDGGPGLRQSHNEEGVNPGGEGHVRGRAQDGQVRQGQVRPRVRRGVQPETGGQVRGNHGEVGADARNGEVTEGSAVGTGGGRLVRGHELRTDGTDAGGRVWCDHG